MIHKDELERLRRERPANNSEVHYTIGGTLETQVHSTLESERIGKLNQGDRRLAEALEDLRHEHAFSSRQGLAKAQFNSKAPEFKP